LNQDPRGQRPDPRKDLPLLNERIRVREVRLIDAEGSQVGVVPTRQAIAQAKEAGLDLLLVQPDANPPVAKIMDYGRFKFEQDKQTREARKKQHQADVKEIKMRYKIEEHDYQVKHRKAVEFLSHGDKIKVVIPLRGREMQHSSIAMELVQRFAGELKELGAMDKEPKIEGRAIIMILSPISTKR
jgi:translation initiation factor IF-3